MANWPTVEEASNLLDIGESEWIEEHLDRALAAAIARVKADCGEWLESADVPDEQLAQAALRLVQIQRVNPTEDLNHSAGSDHVYMSLLTGHRRRFAIA